MIITAGNLAIPIQKINKCIKDCVFYITVYPQTSQLWQNLHATKSIYGERIHKKKQNENAIFSGQRRAASYSHFLNRHGILTAFQVNHILFLSLHLKESFSSLLSKVSNRLPKRIGNRHFTSAPGNNLKSAVLSYDAHERLPRALHLPGSYYHRFQLDSYNPIMNSSTLDCFNLRPAYVLLNL